MSFKALREYVVMREKYIHLFAILERSDVPRDVKQYIVNMTGLNVEIVEDFDDDLKVLAKNLKITLTPDAYHLLNYMLVIIIKDLTDKAFDVTKHRRAKRLSTNDIEYVLDLYPRKNSTLIHLMKNEGLELYDQYIEDKRKSKRQVINTYLDPDIVKKFINEYFGQTKKYHWVGVQIEQVAPIYMTGLLDVFIEQILRLTHLKVITADAILKTCESNIEIKSLMVELFPFG